MSSIIIYGSNYGTTKQYAEELSKRTNIKAISFKKINQQINDYDNIIYLGALYAGGVLGMSKTLKKLNNISNKKILIATVGLSDPTDEVNKNNIRNNIKNQIPKEVLEKAKIFHLRGGIDYSKLNFAHKTMMKLLYNAVKKLPEEKKTNGIRHIVAKKDAIIREVVASKGEIVRRNNDYVKAGDVVISGEIKLNDEVKNKVSAEGTVYGEVWYEVEVEIPYHYYDVKKTGRTNTVYTIEYFNQRFELFNTKPFRQKECKVDKIWEHFVLPIRFQKEEQTEVIKTDKVLTKNEAVQKAVELGIDKMEENLTKKEKIIDVKTLKTTQKNSKMVVDMFFTVYEDITAYAEIKETEEENHVENAQE